MKIIQKSLKGLEGSSFYVKHLEIVNVFLPTKLSQKEIEVLGNFMSFKGEVADKERFGSFYRKEVKKVLGLSDGGLSNHISNLIKKGAISKDEDNFTIKSFLFPEEGAQFYQFKISQNERT